MLNKKISIWILAIFLLSSIALATGTINFEINEKITNDSLSPVVIEYYEQGFGNITVDQFSSGTNAFDNNIGSQSSYSASPSSGNQAWIQLNFTKTYVSKVYVSASSSGSGLDSGDGYVVLTLESYNGTDWVTHWINQQGYIGGGAGTAAVSYNDYLTVDREIEAFRVRHNAYDVDSYAVTYRNFETKVYRSDNDSINLSSGDYEFLISHPNYYFQNVNLTVTDNSTTNTTVNDLYDSQVSITAVENDGGGSINTFEGYVYNAANNFNETFNTTTGTATVNLIQGLDYEFHITSSPNYATNVGSNINITNLNVSSQSIEFSLSDNNTAYFTFFNLLNNSIILDEVNVTMNSNAANYDFTTSAGEYTINEIESSVYTIQSTAAGFGQVQQYVTLNNGEFQTINFYFDTGLESKVFNVIDNRGDPVDTAIVTFTRFVNNSEVTFTQTTTDFSGSVQVNLNPNAQYTVYVEKTGYEVFSGNTTPFDTEYTINIDEEGAERYVSVFEDVSYLLELEYPYFENNSLVSLNILSSNGTLQYYGARTYYEDTFYETTINGSPAGGYAYLNITGINTTFQNTIDVEFFFKSVNYNLTSWNQTFILTNITNLPGTLPQLDDLNELNPGTKAIFGAIIILLLVGAGLASSRSFTVGAICGILGLGLVRYLELFDDNTSLMSLIMLIFVLVIDISTGGTK